eukprot:1007047-Rhodomonas_salina.1
MMSGKEREGEEGREGRRESLRRVLLSSYASHSYKSDNQLVAKYTMETDVPRQSCCCFLEEPIDQN